VKFIKNLRNSSLVVQWNAVGDISDTVYIVYWSSGTIQGSIVTRMTSYTITGLTVDTTYTITVTANNKCGNGPEFTTSVLFFPDTTSTTTIISPSKSSSTATTTITSIVVSNISSPVDVASKFSGSSVTYKVFISPHLLLMIKLQNT